MASDTAVLPSPRGLIRLVARKELLDQFLTLRFHASMLAMVLLLGLSAYVMYGDYQLRMANYSAMRESARQERRQYDVMAVVEPRPLSVFAKGLDEMMTRGYSVSDYSGVKPHNRQRPADSLFSLFAPPDLLYIVKALLSLIALLFAYDSVSGERENGTLKLVLSSSISRGQLVAGKMLGGLASILLPFLAAALAVLAVLATLPGIRLAGEDYVRLGAILCASVLYIVFFFGLGTLVSSLARSSAGALMLLLFLWALLVFAVPNVGNLVAEQIVPLPSAETQDMLRNQEFAKNRFLEIQAGEGTRAEHIDAFNREYDRITEDYRSRLDRMIGVSKALCRLSPAATLSYVFTDLAGTGLAEQRRLTRALLEYKTSLEHPQGRGGAFELPPVNAAGVFARGALADFAVLALSSALMFLAAIAAFIRADVR